jgi:capsular polysaccharide biosynthesis protein
LLATSFPHALLDSTIVEGKLLVEQVHWFLQHGVIVGPHGAAFTNLVFMPSGKRGALVELFSDKFYPRRIFLKRWQVRLVGVSYNVTN